MKQTILVSILVVLASGAICAQKTGRDSQAEYDARSSQLQAEYDARRSQLQAQEAARNNSEPQPITPDMCIDGVCVEQDLGGLALNLNWTPPAKPEDIPNSMRKSYQDAVREHMDTCEQSNRPQWGGNARKLCNLLIVGHERPRAELVSFFKENKHPVCVARGRTFELGLTTSLGLTRFEVRFGKDGRRVEIFQITCLF